MKKLLIAVLSIVMMVAFSLSLTACGELPTIEGVTFTSQTFTYDGEEKTIEVENLPEGANVVYSPSNVQTDAGTYEITATITKENYQTKTITATLTIEKAQMTGISFDDKRVLSGTEATILAKGYPEGATVTYTNEGPYSEKGTYEIGVKIELDNYETYEDTAVLTVVDVVDAVPSRYFAGRSTGKYSTTDGQQYYLCVVEFNEDFTKANLYATKYGNSKKSSDSILNTAAEVSFTSEGALRLEAVWDNGYGYLLMEEDGSSFKTYSGHDMDYWDHVAAEGFEAKPRMYPYSGQYKLDLSSYSNGEVFNPVGWKEEVLNENGEYEETSGNAKIVEDADGKRISLKIGESATSTYRYTYTFSEKPLGDFMFYTLGFKNSSAIRVRFMYENGYGYYVWGSKDSFMDNGTLNVTDLSWISGKNGISDIVGIQIEVCRSETYANATGTAEIIPFTLSYALDA